MPIDNKFRSELARAEMSLKEQESKRFHIRCLLDERKAERSEIDNNRHIMERTGDINKLMALKTRSIALDKSILELEAQEVDCHERVESAKRYVTGLNERLERLRAEAASLSDQLKHNKVPAEVLPQVQTNLRRIKMQIESLTGRRDSRPLTV